MVLERDQLLEELKVYGRDPANADPIFTQEVRAISYTGEEVLVLRRLTVFDKGNRNFDSTRLQQPFEDDLPKCAAMSCERSPSPTEGQADVCRPRL